jgi:cell division cycle 14
MNWLIPNKLLAFASPYQVNVVQGFQVCTPSDIIPIFSELGIDSIVRLNNKTYDENIFKEADFDHIEMYFPDGTCPPDDILDHFLDLVEGNAIVALHCKAGLGRTFSLVF